MSRGKRMTQTEKDELLKRIKTYQESNPDDSVNETCAALGIRPYLYYRLVSGRGRKKSGKKAAAKQQRSETDAKANAYTMRALVDKLEDVLEFAGKVLKLQQERVQDIFL